MQAFQDSSERINVMKKKAAPRARAAPSLESESDEEDTDEVVHEAEDHYKIYPRSKDDDDIVEILGHYGTVLTVNWADKVENPNPKIQLPLLWADYPHTVSKYRLKKKLVGKHEWWRNPTRDLVEELTTIIGHKGDIKKPSKCKFEVLADNGCRIEDVAYSNLAADDKRYGTSLLKTYLANQK